MKKSISINHHLIIFGVPLTLLGFLGFLMHSSPLGTNQTLSLAITADLLLTVPLVYFLLIRKTAIPKTTVIPIMIAGLLIGTYFLPKEGQMGLKLFKTWFLPILEISILAYVGFKVRKAIIKYRTLKNSTLDFFTALKSTCSEILPKPLVAPFVTEIAVIYYGFINWTTRPLQQNEFSYHKKSGTPALLGAIIFIIAIETFALHIVLAKWSVIAAWIFSGLSIYSSIQMLGFAKSLSRRPICLTDNHLILRYGIMNETHISYTDIESVDLSRKRIDKEEHIKKLSPFGELERHNVIIYLKKENTLMGLYGMKKKFRGIALHIDKPEEFKEKIKTQ